MCSFLALWMLRTILLTYYGNGFSDKTDLGLPNLLKNNILLNFMMTNNQFVKFLLRNKDIFITFLFSLY